MAGIACMVHRERPRCRPNVGVSCTQSAGLPGCGACRWSWLGHMRRGAPVGRFTSKRSALTSSIPYSASGRQGIDRSPRGELAHVGRHGSRGAFRRRSSDGPSVGSTSKGTRFRRRSGSRGSSKASPRSTILIVGHRSRRHRRRSRRSWSWNRARPIQRRRRLIGPPPTPLYFAST